MSTQNKWFDMSRPVNADGEKATEAEISIYDQIGGFGISANEFIDGLKELGDVETINVRIASGGGSIVEGNTIFNALKRHSAKVVTHIDSLAASMASVIAMAGDEIRMAENALLMIHNPWTMSMGGAEQLRKDADLLDKMEANIRQAYARSNKSSEELDALMDAETYFTAEEALDAGFIDAIDSANLAAASIEDMDTSEFKLPQAKLDAIQIQLLTKQVAARDEMIDVRDATIETLAAEIDAGKAQVAAVTESFESFKVSAEAALENAKTITEEAIAAKAAELLAETGTPAVEANLESNNVEPVNAQMTVDQFWEGYRALDAAGDYEGKNQFYAEHKNVIGQ